LDNFAAVSRRILRTGPWNLANLLWKTVGPFDDFTGALEHDRMKDSVDCTTYCRRPWNKCRL